MAREFQVEFEYGGKDLRVRGNKVPHVAANTTKGHPDNYTPAEGGQLEDLRIYEMTFHGHCVPLNVSAERKLINDEEFMETLREEV